MNKKLFSLALIFLGCSSALADMPMVTLTNATSCLVTDNNPSKHEKTNGVTVYSFYYDKGVRTYYGQVPLGTSGQLPESTLPYSNIMGVDIGYSADPNNTVGMATGNIPSGWYIIQNVFTSTTWCTKSAPCLGFMSTNPCAGDKN